MREHILLVDDEEGIRTTLSGILEDEGYRVSTVDTAALALSALEGGTFDLLILDVWLPDREGLGLLQEIIANGFDQPVIMISGHGNIDMAVNAIQSGAYDFLEKPLSLSRVLLTVQNAVERGRMQQELRSLNVQLEQRELLIGESPPMQELKEQLSVAAVADTRILITGENGTGKELVARQIHNSSPRADNPFIDVNCAAIPEELIESELFGHVRGAFTGATNDRTGRFEQANGGTLFLDEIADMSLKTQAKVLRVLQEQKFEPVGGRNTVQVDVRVLAATNKDLTDEIKEGRFREDLYFRLAVIPLLVPPLRERREDIPLLIEHFLDHFATELGRRPKSASEAAMECLVHYLWPGNVRELRNLAERLMIMTRGDTIELSDLPAPIQSEPTGGNFDQLLNQGFESLKDARDHFECRYIEQQLTASRGNVSRAARELGLERSNLYRKIKAYGIDVEKFKE